MQTINIELVYQVLEGANTVFADKTEEFDDINASLRDSSHLHETPFLSLLNEVNLCLIEIANLLKVFT